MSKIAGDINREMLGYAEKNTGDCYGDGTVYRGERSADSAVKTYTLQELAHAKGVPSMVTSAMLAIGEDCMKANQKLHALKEAGKLMLEELETYHRQYPGMAKGYVLDAMGQLKAVLKEVEK